jgi:hypothetical protein
MSVDREFATVDAVLATRAETRCVDAFALSVIKAERQLRKLFTYLVFQSPSFSKADVPALRKSLVDNRKVYYDGFIRGIDAISPQPVAVLVGVRHDALRNRLSEAVMIRNKIFHGQLTDRALSADDLLSFVTALREWCDHLASGGLRAFGYDGFARNSFQKSATPTLSSRLRRQFADLGDYREFIGTVLARAAR